MSSIDRNIFVHGGVAIPPGLEDAPLIVEWAHEGVDEAHAFSPLASKLLADLINDESVPITSGTQTPLGELFEAGIGLAFDPKKYGGWRAVLSPSVEIQSIEIATIAGLRRLQAKGTA